MKQLKDFFLVIMFVCSAFSTNAQNMTFDKTVEYIRYKLELNTPVKAKCISFECDKSGNLICVFQFPQRNKEVAGSLSKYQCNINEIDRLSINDEGDFWLVSKTKNIRWLGESIPYDGSPKSRIDWPNTNQIHIYMGSAIEAKRLKSAFEHLKSLTSDPFDK